MAQMNALTKQKRLTDIENSLWLPRGNEVGEGRTGSLGLADVNYYIWDGETTRSCCITQGAILTIL